MTYPLLALLAGAPLALGIGAAGARRGPAHVLAVVAMLCVAAGAALARPAETLAVGDAALGLSQVARLELGFVAAVGALLAAFHWLAGRGSPLPALLPPLVACIAAGCLFGGDLLVAASFLQLAALLAAALMIGERPDWQASVAGAIYLILSALGGMALLFGFVLANLQRLSPGGLVTVPFVVAVLGVGLALQWGVAPLHFWLPNAFQRAGPASTALAVCIVGPATFGLVLQALATLPQLVVDERINRYLTFGGLFTAIFGAVAAVGAASALAGSGGHGVSEASGPPGTTGPPPGLPAAADTAAGASPPGLPAAVARLRRTLGYVFVANLGPVLAGTATYTRIGVAGATLHFAHRGLAALLLLGAAAVLERERLDRAACDPNGPGTDDRRPTTAAPSSVVGESAPSAGSGQALSAAKGPASTVKHADSAPGPTAATTGAPPAPYAWAALLVGGVALAGVPPLGGFAADWAIYQAISLSDWRLAAALAATSVASLAAILTALGPLRPRCRAPWRRPQPVELLLIALAAAVSLWGLAPGPALGAVHAAVSQLPFLKPF